MLLSLTNTHLINKGDEFTTASDIEINASACEMRSVRIHSRHTWSPEVSWCQPNTALMCGAMEGMHHSCYNGIQRSSN